MNMSELSALPKKKPICDYCNKVALVTAANGDRYCGFHMPDDLED